MKRLQFEVAINCDDAEANGNFRHEVPRLLREVARRIEEGSPGSQRLLDANGNSVGRFGLFWRSF